MILYANMGNAIKDNDTSHFGAETGGSMHGWISAFHIFNPHLGSDQTKKHFKCQFKCQNLTHRGSWSGEWPCFLCLCAVHDWNQFFQEGLIRQNTNPLVLHRADENSCCEKAARLRLTRGQLEEWPSAQTLGWDVCGCFKMKL